MIRFSARAHLAILQLDKVANLGALGQLTPRSQSRVGTNLAVVANAGIFDMGKRINHGAGAYRAVPKHNIGLDSDIVAE